MVASFRWLFTAVAFALAFLVHSGSATAQGEPTEGSVTANAAPGDSMTSGELGTVDLFASATDPDGGYEGPTFTGPTWSWSATGAAGLFVNTSSDPQNPTLEVTISPPGHYKLTVKATATWDVSTGGTVDAWDEFQIDLPVVGVQKLQFMDGASSSYSDVTDVLYVPLYEGLSFQAIPTPADSTFPAGKPVWSGSSGATGAGDTTWVDFSDVSTSSSDFKTVTVTCGDTYKTANVIVYDVPSPPAVPGLTVWQVTFSGPNHTVYESFTHQGPFLAPHWMDLDLDGLTTSPGDRAYPVCYTRNTTMQASARFVVGDGTNLPSSILIRGLGPTDPGMNQINIPATSVSVVSGSGEVELPATTATQPFQDAIGYYDPMTITWQYSTDDGLNWLGAGVSNNTAYITMGIPEEGPFVGPYSFVLSVGCLAAQGEKDPDKVIDAVFNAKFGGQAFQHPADRDYPAVKINKGDLIKIIYYKDWKMKPLIASPDPYHDVGAILKQNGKEKDADCLGITNFFRQVALGSQDAQEKERLTRQQVKPKNDLFIMVKNWDDSKATKIKKTINGIDYSYANQFANLIMTGDDMQKDNAYAWKTEDVKRTDGIKGQNKDNPPCIFGVHVVVLQHKNSKKIYDASYGVPYTDVPDLQAKALYGFGTFDLVTKGELRFFIRPTGAATEIIVAAFP